MNNSSFTIKGVLVNPWLRTQEGAEILICNGRIERILPAPSIQAPFILPGFIDSHVHIESSMLIPSEFARMAVRHGTIAAVTDPHEVANVAGEKGIKFMVENAKKVPMNFFFGVPSCVPASPFEKSGCVLDSRIVGELLHDNDFYYLAEMMNFPGVVHNDPEVVGKIEAAVKANKPIDGHAPGLMGEQLKKYAEAGITTDHECSTIKEAVEKIKLGMKILIREGSAAKNFNSLIPLIKDYPKSVMFCTDDCHPDYLQEGHINKIVARAVAKGYDLYDVLNASTLNPIEHYNLPIGRLKENDWADLVVVNDLTSFQVQSTFIKGIPVFSNNRVNFEAPAETEPIFSFRQNHKKGQLKTICKSSQINVIGAIEGELITNWLKEKSPAPVGEAIAIDPQNDFLKIVLLDRYSQSPPVVAFIRGFGLKVGAIAASVAHDSHHIISVGCDDQSIDSALEWIVNNRGGMCFANENTVDGIALPYFGLMTNSNGDKVSDEYKELNAKVKKSGCSLGSPFMTASFMALTVIPELKIYHDGLFDGINFKRVTLCG